MTTYGLLNLGRDHNPARSTRRLDHRTLVALRDALLNGRPRAFAKAAAFLVEINEGDDDNELDIACDVFRGWRCYGERTREPIFLTPEMARGAHAYVDWIPDSAVPHWSPRRSVMHVDLDRFRDMPAESLIATHPAAGPFTIAPRPEWAREPLLASYRATKAQHLEVKRTLHAQGANVTEMCDLNHYHLPGLPGEETVIHAGTDYGRAYPAAGFDARFRPGVVIPVGLDAHHIRVMHGHYHDRDAA